MGDSSKRISWWQVGLVGGVGLSLATLIGAPVKVNARLRAHPGEPIPWGELTALPLLVFAMGFLCGTIVWALRGLSRRFGLLGDALTGMIVMHVFFLTCMFLFAPAMLRGETPGRGGMLLLGTVVGLILGAWIGHDLRSFVRGTSPP